jgi:hypothetical protein
MDKLERYLDQVCRSIAGPRSLREHIRQELREHLLDAAAEHKAAGMTEEAAIARALEDFGGPEQVRAELEATHGHRTLGVVVDKAMQWQERTMKAKWLWMTWAYLAVVGVIAVELFSIAFTNIFLIPKMHKLQRDGVFTLHESVAPLVSRLFAFLDGLQWVCDRLMWWIILSVAVVWGLFEWRVRGEHKPFMRLAALGTAAVALSVVVAIMTGSLSIPFMVGVPPLVRTQKQYAAREEVTAADASVSALEQALAKKDWEAAAEQANRASAELEKLDPNLYTLIDPWETGALDKMQAHLKAAKDGLADALQAARDKDAERVREALKKFREAFAPVQDAAKRLEK